MGKLTAGPQSLGSIIGKELQADSPTWEKLQAQSKEYAELAGTMGKHTPPRGSKESWAKLTAAFADSAGVLDKAVQAKDKEAALKAHKSLSTSCAACHQAHRGRGGMGGGGGRGAPGGLPPGGGLAIITKSWINSLVKGPVSKGESKVALEEFIFAVKDLLPNCDKDQTNNHSKDPMAHGLHRFAPLPQEWRLARAAARLGLPRRAASPWSKNSLPNHLLKQDVTDRAGKFRSADWVADSEELLGKGEPMKLF